MDKLGDLIDELYELREQKRELDTQQKELKIRYDETEEIVINLLSQSGLDQARGETATVSISETEVPQIEDWTKFIRYVKRNDATHLFERRISKSAWSEIMGQRNGKPIPGVNSYVRTRLNLRTR